MYEGSLKCLGDDSWKSPAGCVRVACKVGFRRRAERAPVACECALMSVLSERLETLAGTCDGSGMNPVLGVPIGRRRSSGAASVGAVRAVWKGACGWAAGPYADAY